jgi:hypothetical protein
VGQALEHRAQLLPVAAELHVLAPAAEPPESRDRAAARSARSASCAGAAVPPSAGRAR